MIENNYFINQYMMYMVGFYDRNGKACTLVRERNRILIVDKSPREILEFSIKRLGFNLKGAMETSKEANTDVHMCPIMVNPIMNIVVFPTLSAKRDDAMWFNPDHIHRTHGTKLKDGKTKVVFKNGLAISVDSRLSSYNDKLKRAEQYRDMTIEAAKNPILFILDPKNKKKAHPYSPTSKKQ